MTKKAEDTRKAPQKRVKLRGIERMASMVDKVSLKILHSMLVTGEIETLLRFLPAALVHTFNVHPRMRALQVEPFTAEIQDHVTLDHVNSKNLLRIREFAHMADNGFHNWHEYAADECNIGFDRSLELPFFLTVWVHEKANQARLMLFSDQFMSDGMSGMIILHSILEHVASLASQTNDIQAQELPLCPSFYDMWFYNRPLSKGLVKGLISLLGKAIYRSEMKKFQPLLPPRADQHDFQAPPVTNSTTASFAQGDPHLMRKALASCKTESVTLGGAVVCATLLAFYHAAKALPSFDPAQPFKLAVDVDYNMRQRVPQPVENPVGAYIALADLASLASKGVDVKTTRFWDLARRAKQEIDSKVRQTILLAAVPVVLDRNIHSKMKPSFAKALNIRHSQTSDANLSNVGRFPFATKYALSQEGENDGNTRVLEARSLHVYNPLPHLGSSVVLFVASVESFCYSMGHKCEDDAATAVFNAFVAVCENIGSIGANETLADVLGRLDL